MTNRKHTKSPSKSDEPKAVEIYGRSRIAEFDAAEADLGKVLHRKKLTVRRKSPRRGGR
jgi:hypothetical protein